MQHPPRYPGYSCSILVYRPCNHAPGTNRNSICNPDIPNNRTSPSRSHVFAKHRAFCSSAGISHTEISCNMAVLPYPGVLVHYNWGNMINQQTFFKTIFRDFKAQPVPQHVFPAVVPDKCNLIPERIPVFMILRMP